MGWVISFEKNDLTYKIGWGCVDREDEFEVSFFIAIRSEKVSEIYNLFSRVQPKYQRFSVFSKAINDAKEISMDLMLEDIECL